MHRSLNEKWIKASIIGTIWAASEIVLGSFLHNLRVPFSGNILTAIGIIVLISMSYTWPEKGLFWRAGIICSLMKTMSPSAVIFGPMIAIFMEAIILELFVRMLGRTFTGYILGAMTAVSWNLFQKIVNYIIFYGTDIIAIYRDVLNLAQKQLNIQTEIVWLPIVFLLIIYAMFGLLAGIIGIRIGKKVEKTVEPIEIGLISPPHEHRQNKPEQAFQYSITWLLLDLILIIGSFILLNYTTWFIWGPVIAGIIIIWSFRYKRALRQLSKPGFWIFFIVITLATAFVFTKARQGDNILQKGLLTGFEMNFRAALIITGFSALGTELYNPVIRNFFLNTSFRNLPLALELSVESLPAFISRIPDFRTFIKSPVSVLYGVISQADKRLSELKLKVGSSGRIFIVTGKAGEGKTTFVKNLIGFFSKHNIETFGIISEKVITDSVITGYDVVNISTGEKKTFLRLNEDNRQERIGKFSVSKKGLEYGNRILQSLNPGKDAIIIIDEVGILELRNSGWAESLEMLLRRSVNYFLLVVRDSYLDGVIKKWKLDGAVIFNISKISCSSAFISIAEFMSRKPVVE